MSSLSTWALAGLLLTAPIAFAQTTTAATQTVAPTMTEAEVRKVDTSAGKITLKHGEIKSLDMPPMSMVFHVKDPAMLGLVKVGDKVRFTADKINGAYTVMTLEPAR